MHALLFLATAARIQLPVSCVGCSCLRRSHAPDRHVRSGLLRLAPAVDRGGRWCGPGRGRPRAGALAQVREDAYVYRVMSDRRVSDRVGQETAPFGHEVETVADY